MKSVAMVNLSPPRWRTWRNRIACELWEAIYLSMDVEPETMRAAIMDWMRTDRRSPSDAINQDFCERLTVALENLSVHGPIVPAALRLETKHPRALVDIGNVAAFFSGIEKDFPVPAPFEQLATSCPVVGVVKRAALIAKYLPTWGTIKRDLMDGHNNGLSKAARSKRHGMWFEGKAIQWAQERGKVHQVDALAVVFTRMVHRCADPHQG